MGRPSRVPGLIALAVAALLTSVVYGQRSVGTTPDEYVGSEGCRACHQPEYSTWKNNLHVQMTKPVAEARIAGNFDPGTAFQDHNRAYTMEKRDGRYFITVARSGRAAERFE